MLILEFVRRERGLSQAQVGALAKIAQPTVSLIEQGRYIPAPDQMARLSRALNIAPDVVLRPVTVDTSNATAETAERVAAAS
jgi:transcriptional regulator with XRE-family HTH domain